MIKLIIGIVLIIIGLYFFTFLFDIQVVQDKVLDENTGKYVIKYKEGINSLFLLGFVFLWPGAGFLAWGLANKYI